MGWGVLVRSKRGGAPMAHLAPRLTKKTKNVGRDNFCHFGCVEGVEHVSTKNINLDVRGVCAARRIRATGATIVQAQLDPAIVV